MNGRRSMVLVSYQYLLFDWVAGQPWLTGAVILGVGLLSAFYGVRMLRLLLCIYCGTAGYAIGAVAAELANLPLAVAAGAALVCGAAAVAWPKPATVAVSGATWAVLGAYFADELALRDYLIWSATGLCGGIALLMTVLCRRGMTVLLTSLHGAAMMIVGFVGLSATALPSISVTFRAWSSGRSLVVPVLMGMLVATAYSCQANFCQGNIVTGSEAGPREAPSDPRAAASRKFS